VNKAISSSSPTADFERFVYADVATEPSGMELSVLSALSRRGFDPWLEAQRLAQLPRAAAADSLTQLLGTIPALQSVRVDLKAVAERLVGLLPAQRAASGGPAANTPAAAQIPRGFTVAMTAAILAGMLVPLLMPKPADQVAPSSWIADTPTAPVANHTAKQVAIPPSAAH
jgi:hypothetical protein